METQEELARALDIIQDLLAYSAQPDENGVLFSMALHSNCEAMEFLARHGRGTIHRAGARLIYFTPNPDQP